MMKFADKVRAQYVEKIFQFMESLGEDVGMIESNSFNFPVVLDGVVKVPKDRGDDNYLKRDTYADKVRDRKERAEKAAAKKKAVAEKEKTE